jgi:hypothetical protein
VRPNTWIKCLLPILFVSKSVGFAPPVETTLNTLIYDHAHVGSKILAQAERLAAEIFSGAGIEAQWTTGSVSDGVDLTNDFSAASPGCAQFLHSGTVRVQILAHAPPGFSPQALGYALPCAKSGVQATVYADRVETVSRTTFAVFYRVLGHALAHEIGHVLLRSDAHEDSGLMKGVWAKSDWQRAAVSIEPFTPGESRIISEQLRRVEEYNTPGLLNQQNERGDVVVLASAANKSVDR